MSMTMTSVVSVAFVIVYRDRETQYNFSIKNKII